MSSTVGSPTKTGWNRRSSAGSFSMFSRYSSSVVAPMQRSSPRARAGLSRLAASIEPSALPAPTTRCSSSMNRTIRPSDWVTSLSTALSRSSNSPRNFVPATSAPMSRAMTLRSFRLSGTSPETIRCASPSTIAVLPTPGSPIRTGLFLVRRERTCTTRRISASRPMTGSILPVAGQLDEVAAVLLERLVLVVGVLVGDPLRPADLLQGLEDLLLRDAQRLEQALRLALDLGQGHEQVLDRDVLVLHPVGIVLGRVEDPGQFRAERRLAPGDLGQGVQPFLGRPEDLGGVDAELAEQGADHPLFAVEQGHQQVHRLEPLMPAIARQALGALDRLLALQRQFIGTKRHGMTPPVNVADVAIGRLIVMRKLGE